MQLQRIVKFHKTIADPTRIRILTLLAEGPLHGQALAGKLGLTPATISHHMSKLREVGLIYERRQKNTIYFYLDEKTLRRDAEAVVHLVLRKGESEPMKENDSEKLAVIRNFFTADGKLKQIPARLKKRLIVLEHLIRGLKTGQKYTESEINQYLRRFHEDYATIRRELVNHQFLYRENGVYEVNPPSLWRKIEDL
jgi:biotin operon repressor